MRTGLVLGAGGVVGASWLIGALEALTDEGWDPRSADRIVGTSAGAIIGALLADGVPPSTMSAYLRGGSLDGLAGLSDRGEGAAAGLTPDAYRLQLSLPSFGPGSWRLAVSTAMRPHRHSPSAVLSGWLPRGILSTAPISSLVSQLIPGDWPADTSFWTVATDYRSGGRVVFGRHDAPALPIGAAVAASCAIPGFYAPVCADGRRYVDGGMTSPSNLDVLHGEDLDLVICLNPSSTPVERAGRSPAAHVARFFRTAARRQLEREAQALREHGTRVVLLQPTTDDL
ncbi:MAG: patatin-like phospholipase family protein, partial [Solirubrobacterales bacterium]|nr:patatin-like phospholipase family protein [Solirubrobacterales bacterium]